MCFFLISCNKIQIVHLMTMESPPKYNFKKEICCLVFLCKIGSKMNAGKDIFERVPCICCIEIRSDLLDSRFLIHGTWCILIATHPSTQKKVITDFTKYDRFYLDVSNATKKCYDLHANVIFLLAKSVYDITIVSYL